MQAKVIVDVQENLFYIDSMGHKEEITTHRKVKGKIFTVNFLTEKSLLIGSYTERKSWFGKLVFGKDINIRYYKYYNFKVDENREIKWQGRMKISPWSAENVHWQFTYLMD